MSWKLIKSGAKNYSIQKHSERSFTVRRDDAFTRSGGTKLGSTTSLGDALDIIKSDSGSSQINVRDA